MSKSSIKENTKPWWHTDCPHCKKVRLFIIWLGLMLLADYAWFNLIFSS